MARPTRDQLTERVGAMLAALRRDIAEGRLEPGGYLPSEVELGKTYRLSKETVRKALGELAAEGVIRTIRRVGNQVTGGENGRAVREESVSGPKAGERRSGSGPAEADEADGIVLRLAHYPGMEDEAAISSLVSGFERDRPGIRVKLLPASFPHDYAEHGVADVFTVSAWDALKLKERDSQLGFMDDLPDGETADPVLHKPFLDGSGRAAAAPFICSPVMLVYNREHFEACGLKEPNDGWTWYTLLKNARTLARGLDVRGFAVHIQSVNRWPVFLLQNGFRFRRGGAQRASEDPALWESLRIARELLHQQIQSRPLLTENDADIERWFREGRASMIMTTYFGMNRLKAAGIRYGVAALPSLRTSDTLLLVTGLAVSRQSPNREAALELVRYLCGEQAQSLVRRHTLSLPVHPAAAAINEGLAGNRPEAETSLADLWPRCRLYDDLNLGADVLEAVREELKSYWSRLEDEAEASERLEQLFDSCME